MHTRNAAIAMSKRESRVQSRAQVIIEKLNENAEQNQAGAQRQNRGAGEKWFVVGSLV